MKFLCSCVTALVLWCSLCNAQSTPDIVLFDDGDTPTYHDASWGNVTAPSTLTLAGGGGDKLPLDASRAFTGSKSANVEWRSAAGGDWKLFIAHSGWTAQNAVGYDSLVFYVNARAAVAASALPTIGLETSTNRTSSLIPLDEALPSGVDADTTTWQRVSIALSRFGAFDLSILKDVNFHQNAADNTPHLMWIDNIRVTKNGGAADTTKPAVPQRLVTRTGDRSVVLHWDLNLDNVTAGYRLYRSTSAAGPFAELTASALELPSYADCAVSNGQTYFYYVRAVNARMEASPSSDTIAAVPQPFASDDAFLEYVGHTAFDFFWYEANPRNGLVKDRSTASSSSSIAATGFGLTAIGIAIDRGWITRAEGRDRTLAALTTFWQGPQSILPSNMIGYKGWFYHFLDMKTAVRAGNSELSSIDTGLLLAGMLYAKHYFTAADSAESRIRGLADSIFNRVDWNWMRNNGSTLTMGWNPGSGFINARWTGYNEAMILYILGIGAPSNPLPPSAWSAWTSTYQWFFNPWLSDSFVAFAPLFGHQYSHCWIDFRNTADAYMKAKGITYAENSRRATLAQRLYCIDNPRGAVGYGPNVWGITASDVPTGYAARGTNYNDDGTLNATAPGGSMPFAPEYCLPALKTMYELYRPTIWTGYGFCDAFNLTVTPAWWDPAVLGIDQGPIVIMAENYRTGGVWKTFMKEQIVTNGMARAGFTSVTGVDAEAGAVQSYALSQNYPNPFNPATEVRFDLPKSGHVTLTVHNMLGQIIARVIDREMAAGSHRQTIDASAWASGMYVYTLKAGTFSQTRRMLLLR